MGPAQPGGGGPTPPSLPTSSAHYTYETKATIEALRDDLTTNGRQAAITNTAGPGSLPAGASFNGNSAIVFNSPVTVTGWDFTNYVTVNDSGGTVVLRDCQFGETAGGRVTTGGYDEYHLVEQGSHTEFEWNTIVGPFTFGGAGKVIKGDINITTGAAGSYNYRRNRSYGLSADTVKSSRGLGGDPQVIEWNYTGPPSFIRGPWTLTNGDPAWDSNRSYAVGDYVFHRYARASGGNATKAFRCLQSSTGQVPYFDNVGPNSAFWREEDPHADFFTLVGSIDGVIVQHNYVDYTVQSATQAPADVHAAWLSAGGPGQAGVNNLIRSHRNNGTSPPVAYCVYRNNVLVKENQTGVPGGNEVSFMGQLEANGTNHGPISIYDNWIGARNGSLTAAKFHPAHGPNLGHVGNNLRYEDDVLITEFDGSINKQPTALTYVQPAWSDVDGMVMDCGFAVGRGYAEIAMSGTGDAGAAVGALDPETNSWQTIATVLADGTWAGTLRASPFSASTPLADPQVRLAGNTGISRSYAGMRFAAGSVIGALGQSEIQHCIQPTFQVDMGTTVSNPDLLKILYVDNDDTQGSTLSLHSITTGSKRTEALAAASNFAGANGMGYVLLVDFAHSGRGRGPLVNDNESTRTWGERREPGPLGTEPRE